MRRCFLCAAAMWGATERSLRFADGTLRRFDRACGSCGVLVRDGAGAEESRRDLLARLGGAVFAPDPAAPYGLDLYTLRTAATGLGRGVRPLDARGWAELLAPHGAHAGQATLVDLAPGVGTVALGVICRPEEVAAVLAGLPAHAGWADEAVILADAPDAAPRPVPVAGFPPGGVRVAARPLAGDFAGQRNALQGLARRGWMLQLDADEGLDPAAGALLPALASLAEEGGAVSIGLARRNLVDGVLADLYPDVQYRLNRTEVRYRGCVHERPETGGWPRSFIALHGTIAHRLDGAHVRARSRRYEAMAPGQGRLEEEAALLRPYRD